ncbi:MAG: DUF5615 family PIN-like protein [Planctomycetes bacterium]|nr:DUF5615 family PIN-like protein [Planctomycetota bacterium]
MGIRIKVDEDLPSDIAAMLRAAGHDAVSVVEQGLTGTADEALWPIVQRETRCLFTADKGFADIRIRPPGSHSGVVLFRLPFESRAGYIRLAQFFVRQFDLNETRGAIIVVSPDEIRIHRGE